MYISPAEDLMGKHRDELNNFARRFIVAGKSDMARRILDGSVTMNEQRGIHNVDAWSFASLEVTEVQSNPS
jgi:hypothetical protein